MKTNQKCQCYRTDPFAVYGYDAVGNLTGVTYPVSPASALDYDALNRLTNMVDAVGTTVYGYDNAGQLLSEGGLWPDDTVYL